MKKLSLYIICLALSATSLAQVKFISSGKIEFERKTNTHRLYYSEEDQSSWSEQIMKLIPRFKVDYFNLTFNETASIYQPGRENPESRKSGFITSPAQENIVYKDLTQNNYTSQKQIFESNFLIADSLRNVEWRMEPETRTIAGFECRKAVGRICDSVVVVAFYTDEIVPVSGPEGFQGLPGMILGLAIPRLYSTWFATKLELITPAEASKIKPPTRGKKSSREEMITTIDNGIKSWGTKYRDRAIWFATL